MITKDIWFSLFHLKGLSLENTYQISFVFSRPETPTELVEPDNAIQDTAQEPADVVEQSIVSILAEESGNRLKECQSEWEEKYKVLIQY